MTIEYPSKQRERLSADPREIFALLPGMGRVMIAASGNGVTHERIGVVAAVTNDGAAVRFQGDDHDSRVEADRIAFVIVDRSSVMKEKVYPRLEFLDALGKQVMNVVGFDGLEPFDAAIRPLGGGAAIEPEPRSAQEERAEASDDDLGARPLLAAVEGGKPITVRFDGPGFSQQWQGTLEAVRPAMGFINIIRPDFHLHLKAGVVAGWRRVGDEQVALDADGSEIGLRVIS